MPNTVIQIKRSTVTTVPGSLGAGEPAYSYLSDKLFIGNSTGTGVIEIGGRFYNNIATQAYEAANAAFNQANTISSDADEKANAALITANIAFDTANAANLLAYNTGIGAGAYADAVGVSANAFTSATIAGANTAVGTGANAFTSATIAGANTAVGAGANAYANLVWSRSNTYADTVGTSANAFTSETIAGANTAVGAGANAFASATIAGANAAVGLGANTYADATFVKLAAPNQTITSNLSIVGSFTVSGNTTYVNVNDLQVSDPLIYLAANNYVSDIVDIGFIGNYVNATGSNVHTGLYREHVDKMYYLFQEYAAEPVNNHLGAFSNNMSLAVLNADIRTSNLVLGGQNTIVWLNSIFDKANVAGNSAAASANAFTSATIAGANTAVGAGANAYASIVGTSANAYAAFVAGLANTNAANASYINTGTLAVAFGGTGVNTLANNGVLFGNTTSALRTAETSTEGHVLQANQFGTPFFGMLDGGSF